MYALSRSQTLGPHLTNESFGSSGVCLPQHQQQHHTTGLKTSAGMHLHEPLGARIWSDTLMDAHAPAGSSRCLGSDVPRISPQTWRHDSTTPLEPNPCILRVCTPSPSISWCTDITDLCLSEVRHGKLIEILLRQRWRRCNGRLLGCCWRSVTPGVRMTAYSCWVCSEATYEPHRDRRLDDLIQAQRSTTAAALVSVSSGGLREADTRSCLPFPIPPRPRSRATSI